MKKIKVFFVFLIALAIGSCNYEFTEDIELDAITQGKVAKVFLGGNVECSQLSLVDPAFENLALTTGRNDFAGGTFVNSWPVGLEVEVMADGSISWALTPEFDLMGDGSCYKVGAAIVKGSAASNVYYYGPDGATGDMGLFPPVNASGTPSALSNLTFCFVECKDQPKLVISFKGYKYPEGFATSASESSYLDFYDLELGKSYKLYYYGVYQEANLVGNLTITDNDNDHFWEINLDNTSFYHVFIYVGPASGWNLDYEGYTYNMDIYAHSPVLELPFKLF